MSNFKKIFGLAGAVVVFAGLASAQAPNVTCMNPTADNGNVVIRAEGQTELVSNLSFTCNNTGAANATVTITDTVSTAITSKPLGTAGYTEALLVVTAGTTASVQGTTNGTNGLNFAVSLAPGVTSFTLTNVRVDATKGAISTAITESLSAITQMTAGPAVVTPITTSPALVATPVQGLVGVKLSTGATAGLVICNPYTANAAFTIQFSEGYTDAFKIAGTAGTNNAPGNNFALNTETGYSPLGGFPAAPNGTGSAATANVANSGTKVKITFASVPAGVTLFVPLTVTSGAGTLTLVTSESTSTAAGSTTVGITGGAGTAVYEYQSNGAAAVGNTTIETFQVPVTFTSAANAVAQGAAPFTATVSLAPNAATPGATIPTFTTPAAPVTLTGPTFGICSTSLLFPFVTNQLGFDTGFAIANTSTGNGAVAQAGTCQFNFFGSGAPATAVPATSSLATGATYTALLSNLAPGFQGYAIANCNFQFAHGFTFITYQLGSSSGVAEGYLALVLNSSLGARGVGANNVEVTSF